jgi:hypothetical protein
MIEKHICKIFGQILTMFFDRPATGHGPDLPLSEASRKHFRDQLSAPVVRDELDFPHTETIITKDFQDFHQILNPWQMVRGVSTSEVPQLPTGMLRYRSVWYHDLLCLFKASNCIRDLTLRRLDNHSITRSQWCVLNHILGLYQAEMEALQLMCRHRQDLAWMDSDLSQKSIQISRIPLQVRNCALFLEEIVVNFFEIFKNELKKNSVFEDITLNITNKKILDEWTQILSAFKIAFRRLEKLEAEDMAYFANAFSKLCSTLKKDLCPQQGDLQELDDDLQQLQAICEAQWKLAWKVMSKFKDYLQVLHGNLQITVEVQQETLPRIKNFVVEIRAELLGVGKGIFPDLRFLRELKTDCASLTGARQLMLTLTQSDEAAVVS